MWIYEKKLQFPVNIKNPNPQMAKIIMTQLGGPDGELGAANRYLSQRYSMPYNQVKGILTDVGTEELGHAEMISAIVYQLTRNMSIEQIKSSGFDGYFVEHTAGIYPVSAGGIPFSADGFASKGDAITDLTEDMAADGATSQKQHYNTKIERTLSGYFRSILFNDLKATGFRFIADSFLHKHTNRLNRLFLCIV